MTVPMEASGFSQPASRRGGLFQSNPSFPLAKNIPAGGILPQPQARGLGSGAAGSAEAVAEAGDVFGADLGDAGRALGCVVATVIGATVRAVFVRHAREKAQMAGQRRHVLLQMFEPDPQPRAVLARPAGGQRYLDG